MSKEYSCFKDCGEENVISQLINILPKSGKEITKITDDCSVIDKGELHYQLLKTDSLIEGVHFYSNSDPILVGNKAINRALSDIASMGGTPEYALVNISFEETRPLLIIKSWYKGMVQASKKFDCFIVGGDTCTMPSFNNSNSSAIISVSIVGKVNRYKCIFREGAKLGDLILVTGKLGGSFESNRHLTFTPRIKEAHWLSSNNIPSSMMDISDGLGSDLPKLMKVNNLGYEVDINLIPCHKGVTSYQAICDGEDYELLFTCKKDKFHEFMHKWKDKFPQIDLTPIGKVVKKTTYHLPRSWEHGKSNFKDVIN